MYSGRMAKAAFIALIGFGTTADLAFAHDQEDANERAALQNAKLTLNEAIAVAEREIPGGSVVDADVETENGTVSYAIDIDKDGVQTVLVDLQTGNVLRRVAATQDDDEGNDDDDRPRRMDDDDDDDDNGRRRRDDDND